MFLALRNVSTSTVRNSLDSAKFDLNPKLSRCGALHIGVQLKGDLNRLNLSCYHVAAVVAA